MRAVEKCYFPSLWQRASEWCRNCPEVTLTDRSALIRRSRKPKVVAVALSKIEQQALRMLDDLERRGRSVSRVTIEGKRVEFEFAKSEEGSDEFDGLDMKYGKA
jgi:hypothetical protein